VLEPERWAWSSSCAYALDERGSVLVNEQQKIELHGGAHASKTTKRGAA
jgi:hypothetical protein